MASPVTDLSETVPVAPEERDAMTRARVLDIVGDEMGIQNLRAQLEGRRKGLATEWYHLDTERQAIRSRLNLVDLMGYRFRSDAVKGAKDDMGRNINGHNSAVNALRQKLMQLEYDIEVHEMFIDECERALRELPASEEKDDDADSSNEEEAAGALALG